MKPFNIGDAVICVDNKGFNTQLTLGRKYIVKNIIYSTQQWQVDVNVGFGWSTGSYLFASYRFRRDRVNKINRILSYLKGE